MSSARRNAMPASVRQRVRDFHLGGAECDDASLDRLLGLAPDREDRLGRLPALLRRFGNQNFGFQGMTFPELREIFRVLDPRPDELFCDLGAGYGRVVFYGACVAPCAFRAVEILPQRCAAMRRAARRLGLRSVEVVAADARSHRHDDAAYLFVNSPFFPDAAQEFMAALALTGDQTVIAVNNIVDLFRKDRRFVELHHDADIAPYRFGMFRAR